MRSTRIGRMAVLACALLGAAYPGFGYAFCSEGRKPSLEEETSGSAFVFIGKMTGRTSISSPEDPSGIEAFVYEVRVLKTFRGNPGSRVSIRSDNTSSRFNMEIGREYLMFVTGTASNGLIDSCGNSGPAEGRVLEIEQLKRR